LHVPFSALAVVEQFQQLVKLDFHGINMILITMVLQLMFTQGFFYMKYQFLKRLFLNKNLTEIW